MNLIPRSIVERRQRNSLIRRWVIALLAAVAVVIVAAGAAFAAITFSTAQLAAENARTGTLLTRLAALAPVREKLALEKELGSFRAEAMGTDLSWAGVLGTASGALPAGVTVTGFDLSPGILPADDEAVAGSGLVGILTLESATTNEMVPYIRALRQQAGVLGVVTDGWSLKLENGSYRYEIRLQLDQSVYTGTFAPETAQ